MTVIDNRFKSNKPVFCAQGRYDDVIICQGDGVKPSRWVSISDDPCTDAGIIAPVDEPVIELDATPAYYVARTDIKKPGAIYYSPPVVTYSYDRKLLPVLDDFGNPYDPPQFVEEEPHEKFVEADSKSF